MKNRRHYILFCKFMIIVCFSIISISTTCQVKYNIDSKNSLNIIQMFSGVYRNCDVRLGNAEGVGYVRFGKKGLVSSPDILEFSISIWGRSDAQYGKLDKLKIETSDYKNFTLSYNWTNSKKWDGTLSATVKILYTLGKTSCDSYFINNSNTLFEIHWISELDHNSNLEFQKILNKLFFTSTEYIRYNQKKYIEDSLFKLKQKELANIKQTNDSIQFAQKKYNDSVLRVKKIHEDSILKAR